LRCDDYNNKIIDNSSEIKLLLYDNKTLKNQIIELTEDIKKIKSDNNKEVDE